MQIPPGPRASDANRTIKLDHFGTCFNSSFRRLSVNVSCSPHPALGCAECLLYPASGRIVDLLPVIIRSGIPNSGASVRAHADEPLKSTHPHSSIGMSRCK